MFINEYMKNYKSQVYSLSDRRKFCLKITFSCFLGSFRLCITWMKITKVSKFTRWLIKEIISILVHLLIFIIFNKLWYTIDPQSLVPSVPAKRHRDVEARRRWGTGAREKGRGRIPQESRGAERRAATGVCRVPDPRPSPYRLHRGPPDGGPSSSVR